MRKVLLALSFLCLVMIMCSCGKQTYILDDHEQNVLTIDVIDVSPYKCHSVQDYLDMEAVATIPTESLADFLQELTTTPCYSYLSDPSLGIRGYTVRIRYQDNSYELICAKSGCFIDNGKRKTKAKYFDEETFITLIKDFSAAP